jgi:hypothetical protein
MPPKQAAATPASDRSKRTATAMASVETDDEPTMLETLQRQLAESQAQTAVLQAALDAREAYGHPTVLTDEDHKRIVAAMLRQQSRADSTNRSARTDTPAETPRRSAKVTEPPLLSDGKDPTFTSWSILILAKLQDNDDHFPSERSKLTYVYGHTTGDAQAHLEPRFEYGARNPFQTVDQAMAYLAAIYQNPMRQAIAQDQYYDLRQGRTEPFSEFLTKFQHLAGLGDISENNWKQDLYRKLNVLYQENLVATLPTHDTYEKLVVQCQHLEHVLLPLLARKAAERANRRTSPTRRPARTPANPSPPAPTSSALVLARSSPTPFPQRTVTSREPTPAPGLSGITCYNCGKEGHKVHACPEPRKPGTIHEIDEQGLESDSTDLTDEDSGKEDP